MMRNLNMRPAMLVIVFMSLLMTPAIGQRGGGDRGQGGRQQSKQRRTPPLVAAVDTDGNGELSSAEIARAPVTLLKLDANRDGRLTAEELTRGRKTGDQARERQGRSDGKRGGRTDPGRRGDRQTRQRRPGGRLMRVLDTDNDGILSKIELKGAAKTLKDLDRDRNGTIGRDEWSGRGGGSESGNRRSNQGGSTLLRLFDTDHDGSLSPDEIRRAPALLKALDRDGDGEVSEAELRPPGDDRRRKGGAETEPTTPGASVRPRIVTRPEAKDGFVLIPGGTFSMGDHHDLGGREHRSDEVPLHTIRLTSFYMATTELTNTDYCAYLNGAQTAGEIRIKQGTVCLKRGAVVLCDTTLSDPASGILWSGSLFTVREGRGSHPMVGVRWFGAVTYCNWLSEQRGFKPCYDLDTWACDRSLSGFRLPTEAEWEYAARGGQYGPYFIFPWGNSPDRNRANWPGSGDPFEVGPYPWTTPVGFFNGKVHRREEYRWPGKQKTYTTADGANGYGLYDMTGNVWEWTGDWYTRTYYGSSPSINPPGPMKGQPMRDGKSYRVLRSGSWFNGQWGHGRVANRNPAYYRGPDDPDHRWYHIGFRPVRSGPDYLAPSTAGVRDEERQADRRERRGGGEGASRGREDRDGRGGRRDEGRRRGDRQRGGRRGERPEGGDDRPRREGGREQDREGRRDRNRERFGSLDRRIGLIRNTAAAAKGYTLFAPKHYNKTYLIDNEGRVVNTWESQYEPGQSVYLLPSGNLLHCCFKKSKGFTRGGEGGRIEEYDWQGRMVWEFDYSSDRHLTHHDIAPLPNGNILALAVEKKSYAECLAVGFTGRMLRDRQLFPDTVIEIKPTRPKGGRIVWKWNVWDHLVQNTDPTKPNYGRSSDRPERISVNVNGRGAPAFWNHMNSIDYHPGLDQIMLSVRGSSEIWIIDHSTSTKEAAGSKGGRYGRGGDLLYRWGNPAAYGRGTGRDQILFQQHDAQWIRPGCPGAGNILVFNNGLRRTPPGMTGTVRELQYAVGKDWGYSSVDELVPPLQKNGTYRLDKTGPYGPTGLAWTYRAEKPTDFFAEAISGCQRLPGGTTLICDGTSGVFFEVDRSGKKVWEYVCPVGGDGPLGQGDPIPLDHRRHAMNAVFKIWRYPPDHPGLVGRKLEPKGVLIGRPGSSMKARDQDRRRTGNRRRM